MLDAVGYASVDALMDAAVPGRHPRRPRTPRRPCRRPRASARRSPSCAGSPRRNRVARSMIGQGYYDTITPAVIQRNVLENPSWYTAYTPYQPEISQGRLEALINFQTMVADLTGLATANASMLDEATAVVEGMLLARRASGSTSNVFLVDADALPQTRALLAHRAEAVGIELHVTSYDRTPPPADLDVFGAFIQYPGSSGRIWDPSEVIAAVKAQGGITVVGADLLALTLITSPGELGADVAVGTSQRFGVPMGYGGPHAGYLAVRAGLERQLPGRLVGVSQDASGYPAYRLSLQTREQHIRREKATSNICTAQVLLAVMASMYAVYHGPAGLKRIAHQVNRNASLLADALTDGGVELSHAEFFDTVQIRVPGRADAVIAAAAAENVDLWRVDADSVTISVDETTTSDELRIVLRAVLGDAAPELGPKPVLRSIAPALARTSEYLTHPVFHTHHSETGMMRYLKYLADKDYALDRGMIPLGSCTMKLNAATEMAAVTWPEFANIHPFAPASDVQGYLELIGQLEGWLADVTGYDAVSLQPNAGSQGELAGLLAIRAYHRANGDARPHGLPHPVQRARHQRGQRRARRHARRRGRLRRPRQRRPRRPARQGRGARRRPRRADGDLPVHARRVRARDPRRDGCRPRGRRAGLRRRRQPERAARLRPVRRLRRRRLAPEPAQDLLHPARRRRSRCRPGGGEGAPRAVPARASARRRDPPFRVPPAHRAHRLGRAVRQPEHPADQLVVRADDGRRRPAPRDRRRRARRQLRRHPAAPALPDPVLRRITGSSRTNASWTCDRCARPPGSRSTTWPSGSSTTASTRRPCRSRSPAR